MMNVSGTQRTEGTESDKDHMSQRILHLASLIVAL